MPRPINLKDKYKIVDCKNKVVERFRTKCNALKYIKNNSRLDNPLNIQKSTPESLKTKNKGIVKLK